MSKEKRPGLFESCTNLFGKLNPELQARLRAVACEAPTPQTWEDAFTIIIDGKSFKTLWQAVLDVDPHFARRASGDTPEERWSRVPDQLTIVRALRSIG